MLSACRPSMTLPEAASIYHASEAAFFNYQVQDNEQHESRQVSDLFKSYPQEGSYRISSFMEHNTTLCKWQHDLEWILFTLCKVHMPHVIISRGWTSYRAAELTLLTEVVTRFCMDQKQLVAAAGVAGNEREDFVRDLQTVRAIRHAAVHRSPVSKATMRRFSVCVQRLSSTAKRIIGPSVDKEYHGMVSDASVNGQ
jgi:hypothetical protein